MKSHEIGATLLIAGVLLFGFVHLTAVIHMNSLIGYTEPSEIYFYAMQESKGMVAYVISIVMGVLGLFSLFTKYPFFQGFLKHFKDQP